jgi:hypothetical protein
MELYLILSFIIILIIILIIIIVLVKINSPYYIDNEFTDFETGCKPTRYGCCNDKITTKLDTWGSNCYGS